MHQADRVTSRVRAGGAGGRRRALALAGAVAVATGLAAVPAPTSAVVPGPNGKIAFESNRDGTPDIFVMNSDGSVETNITKHPANDFFPVWSPDASEIAFGSDRAQAGNVDVWVMDADGSDPVQLTSSPGEDRGASWTSDGARIVFHSARNRVPGRHAFDVFTMNSDGSNETMIFENGSAAYACGDSFSGRIVFNSNRDGNFEIYTMNLDGSDLFQVTDTPAPTLNSGPKFSPDCSQISFNRTDAGGSLDVWRVGADGSGATNLTNNPGVFDAFSAWSPDGTRIVFSTDRDINFEIYAMDSVDGGDLVRYTETKRGEGDLRADWGTAPNSYGPPTDRDQCRKDRWTEFQTPTFASQEECVSYVVSGSIVNDA